MTHSDRAPATLPDAFDFARQQRDPAFRAHLRNIGWTPEQPIIVVHDDEPVIEVLARLIVNAVGPSCLIAIPNPAAKFGFNLMFANAVSTEPGLWRSLARRWARRPDTVDRLSAASTIGMLYSSQSQCDEFVPSAWAHPVQFKRPAAA